MSLPPDVPLGQPIKPVYQADSSKLETSPPSDADLLRQHEHGPCTKYLRTCTPVPFSAANLQIHLTRGDQKVWNTQKQWEHNTWKGTRVLRLDSRALCHSCDNFTIIRYGERTSWPFSCVKNSIDHLKESKWRSGFSLAAVAGLTAGSAARIPPEYRWGIFPCEGALGFDFRRQRNSFFHVKIYSSTKDWSEEFSLLVGMSDTYRRVYSNEWWVTLSYKCTASLNTPKSG
jgi:hypothetical protein